MTVYAVVRVRGTVRLRGDIGETLRLLHLTRTNHCVLVPPKPPFVGMLHKTKDYVTWGEVRPDVLARLLKERGRLPGDKPIDNTVVKATTGHATVGALAKALEAGELDLHRQGAIKPVFRLHPPTKGYEGIKRAYGIGGALGYRGDAINDLLLRMLG